jgi:hypothetical protein
MELMDQNFEIETFSLRSVKPLLPAEIAAISPASVVELKTSNKLLTFNRHDTFCRQVFDDECSKNGGNLSINEGRYVK